MFRLLANVGIMLYFRTVHLSQNVVYHFARTFSAQFASYTEDHKLTSTLKVTFLMPDAFIYSILKMA